ncbi:MAG TPA: hypothetical protein VIL92_06490 [Gaiellaceae bacterium]
MRKLAISLGFTSLVVGVFAADAFATVTVPAVPVSTYGDALLSGLSTAITAVLPYAAGITAFAIGVGMLKRWLGHRKATHV